MLTKHILDYIGYTPIIEIKLSERPPNSHLYLKLETFNPTGSMKDRSALKIIEEAEKQNLLAKDTTIIESSSGNFGVSLALICALRKYKSLIVVDPRTSKTNISTMRAYGAQIEMVNEKEQGSYQLARIRKVEELSKKINNSFVPNQYSNENNPLAHYETTGAEILSEVNGKVSFVIVPVSTGGTISGIGRRIKKDNPHTKIIAVDAEGSVIFGGKPKARFMSGMGSNFTPKNLDTLVIDDVKHVNDLDAFKTCRYLAREHALLLGGSSGAAFYVATQYYLKSNKNTVVLCPDRGEKYLDTIFNDKWYEEYVKKKSRD